MINTAVLSLLIGALAGLALCAVGAIFVPTTPDIADTLDRLYSPEAQRRARAAATTPPQFTRQEVFGLWVQRHTRWLPLLVSRSDLEAIEGSIGLLYTTKAAMAIGGASVSVLMGTAQALMGTPSIALPGFIGIVLAVGGWFVPDVMAQQAATAKRETFARTVTAYYDLVCLMRLSGATVTDAITVPAQIADAPLFVRIRGMLTRQQLEHKRPWDGLIELSNEIDLPELHDLGDLMTLSGDRGTPAAATLRAKAADIRSERLNQDMELAQRDLQRSTVFQVMLLAVILSFLALPPLLRLIS